MSAEEIKISWTEEWTFEHTVSLAQAREWAGLDESATADEVANALMGDDSELADQLAEIEIENRDDAEVYREDIDVEVV
ncbi:hypothetical protein [Lentzea flava]|uniref:Uncharacterized protein n=1 Tax=Lentzea flava TaxID=103732 RepID=A0ABQ2UQS0_9PSEU|nr:hypothetical protein [Lentzea flava]MCP2200048.1 hypothetical protein [Lentzea flava]GGU45789.1 hypothetical protein GCM10010178_42820 [Lentzea flava]